MKAQEAILECQQRGYSAFPLLPEQKKPAGPWKVYSQSFMTRDEIVNVMSNANVAIACGPVSGGLHVVDADDQRAIEWVYANLPKTPLVQRTPRGGKHFCYRTETTEGNRASVHGMKLDTRGMGGYIVAYPSVVNGKQYQWEDQLVTPDKLPIINPTELFGTREISKKGDPQAAEKYISRIESIEHNGGDRALFKAACALVQKFELSFSQALPILEQWNQTNARPPWPEQRLEYKLQEAVRLHGSHRDRIKLVTEGSLEMVRILDYSVGQCSLCKKAKEQPCVNIQFTDGSFQARVCIRHFHETLKARTGEKK